MHCPIRLTEFVHLRKMNEGVYGKGNSLQGGIPAAKGGGNEGPEGECGDFNPYSLMTMQRSHPMSLEEFKKGVSELMPEHAGNAASRPQIIEGMRHRCHPV